MELKFKPGDVVKLVDRNEVYFRVLEAHHIRMIHGVRLCYRGRTVGRYVGLVEEQFVDESELAPLADGEKPLPD